MHAVCGRRLAALPRKHSPCRANPLRSTLLPLPRSKLRDPSFHHGRESHSTLHVLDCARAPDSPRGRAREVTMKLSALTRILVVLALAAVLPVGAQATDVDGPNDCTRTWSDFGDAPEGFDAYPGITGRFPSCLAVTGPSTQTAPCPAPGSPPGAATGYVRHLTLTEGGFWLGCAVPGGLPMGVDSEPDAKTSPALPTSFCSPNVPVDCIEPAPWGSFGQDECFGSDDAGLIGPTMFAPCTSTALNLRIT